MAKGKLHFLHEMWLVFWTGRVLKRAQRICWVTKHKHFKNNKIILETHPVSDLKKNPEFQSKTSGPQANSTISSGKCFPAVAISSKRSFLIMAQHKVMAKKRNNSTSLQCPKKINWIWSYYLYTTIPPFPMLNSEVLARYKHRKEHFLTLK